jgi:outer membrane receptor for Fe3+-dicitrate
VVGRDDLTQLAPQHAGDVLRTVPSVNVVGEDPMGLRLNLSIRGLDPNRSRKVLVLEDGVPVSLNPYGSPELYYTPPIERMERVEVVRGSGQILWGPQTLGGVIHYVTREPPRRLTLHADLRYGSFGYLLAALSAGDTQGAVGWRLDVLHRRFEGPRALDAAVTDVNGQLRLQLSPRATLRLKLDFYDESSRATYLGLKPHSLCATPRSASPPMTALTCAATRSPRRTSTWPRRRCSCAPASTPTRPIGPGADRSLIASMRASPTSACATSPAAAARQATRG